ncbi:ROK family protein [Mesoplasma florum]|uniref:ROK family protein n=1 Tax=Mesoplasma florum TaxID=2151 RepID=UPI000BE46AA7|nr:ROK family protein [Mesoplasma florum]ATI72964.1 hypothetical protein CQZ69_00050 [Mesoplasma florum]AVN61367.1 hypothetical protein CG004_00050 [Mesoplasma florum]
MKKLCFDIGGMSTKCLIFKNKEVVKKDQIFYLEKEERVFNTKLKEVFDLISIFILKEIGNDENFEIGLSIPGVIDSTNKKIIEHGAIVDEGLNIEEYFSKFKNLKKIIIENDAKAAAYGEFIYGNHKNISNLVHLTIGTGLGCGIIWNNQIMKSTTNRIGELGKQFSDICYKENDSVVVIDTSMAAILMRYQMLTGKIIDGIELFKLWDEKEINALKIIDDWSTAIARTVINLDYLLDYDLLTIGGGVSSNNKLFKILLDKIEKFNKFTFMEFELAKNLNVINKVKISNLKNNAACYGLLALLEKE